MKSPSPARCVQALTAARRRLQRPDPASGYASITGSRQYICLALGKVAERDHMLLPAVKYLTKLIENRLGEHFALESWLLDNFPEGNRILMAAKGTFDTKVYHTRLAWIDALIQEQRTRKEKA